MSRDSGKETLGDLMRRLREAAGVSLSNTARTIGFDKGHLSHVEKGRDRPSGELVAFYETLFNADGQLWSAYVEAVTGHRPRSADQTAGNSNYPIPGDAAAFIADVTVPDGTVMPPDFEFEKIWRVQNSGTVPWNNRWLRRLGSPAGLGLPRSPLRVPIPDTEPGEIVDIEVSLRAHPLPGTAEVHWKMVDDDGHEFFPDRYYQGIFMTIVVREGAPPPVIRRLV